MSQTPHPTGRVRTQAQAGTLHTDHRKPGFFAASIVVVGRDVVAAGRERRAAMSGRHTTNFAVLTLGDNNLYIVHLNLLLNTGVQCERGEREQKDNNNNGGTRGGRSLSHHASLEPTSHTTGRTQPTAAYTGHTTHGLSHGSSHRLHPLVACHHPPPAFPCTHTCPWVVVNRKRRTLKVLWAVSPLVVFPPAVFGGCAPSGSLSRVAASFLPCLCVSVASPCLADLPASNRKTVQSPPRPPADQTKQAAQREESLWTAHSPPATMATRRSKEADCPERRPRRIYHETPAASSAPPHVSPEPNAPFLSVS